MLLQLSHRFFAAPHFLSSPPLSQDQNECRTVRKIHLGILRITRVSRENRGAEKCDVSDEGNREKNQLEVKVVFKVEALKQNTVCVCACVRAVEQHKQASNCETRRACLHSSSLHLCTLPTSALHEKQLTESNALDRSFLSAPRRLD